MKILRNEDGVALVMVMLLAFIGLAIVSALLFMVTQSTQLSGAMKFYRSTEEAGYGGADISAQFVRDNIFNGAHGITLSFLSTLNWSIPGLSGGTDACLNQKLSVSRGDWAPATTAWTQCTDVNNNRLITLDPTVQPDFQFELSGESTYRVYAKIVDTIKGNTEESSIAASGALLGGTAVVNSAGGEISPPPNPSLYRMEVQSQDVNNPRERARFSVLYAF